METGGITVENTSTGGYNADFGIAQLRVAADQEWNVAEGRIVISVTHSLSHLDMYDSILVMHQGLSLIHI